MTGALDENSAELLPLPAVAIREGGDPVTPDVVDATLIFFGLDNAGKSTIMQILANDRQVVQQPTLHPSALEVVIGKVRFKAFDLAGHETGRRLWNEYFAIANAVFFLVDAADRSRFPEAAEELRMLLSEKALQAIPIAVLGMKTDLKDAASEEEFCIAMGLLCPDHSEKVKVFMCSTIEMTACQRIGEAVLWLSADILEHQVRIPSKAPSPVEIAPEDFGCDMMV